MSNVTLPPVVDFAVLERVSRRSLRMYDLTERERRVSEVIIDFSFARGRESAVIPELQAFVDLTGLDKGDVSRALQLLEARGIVQRSGRSDARVYAFIPSAAFWKEKRPLYDMERAIARAAELARINELAPGADPDGQVKLALPADEPGLDEGMAMAARCDAARADKAAVGVSPIGETPIQVSKAATSCTRARDVSQNVVQNVKQNVIVGDSPIPSRSGGEKAKRFRDEERNYIFEELEKIAHGPDFEKYRGKWIQRVQDFPGFVREAVGDAKIFLANPRNKLKQSAGALIFARAQRIAREAGKKFHLL